MKLFAENKTTKQHDAKVYVVDDDASVREALQDLFASVGLIAYCFALPDDFLAYLHANPPNTASCLVLDIRMPQQNGLALYQNIGQQGLALPTTFITGHGDIPMSVQAMKAGAIEFLTKPFREQDLLDAVWRGIEINRQQRAEYALTRALRQRWHSLSLGEQAVLKGVVRGQLNKQMAADLQLSEITIKVRRSQALRKMQLRTIADLVRALQRLGINENTP